MATALTNLFVGYFILLPAMVIAIVLTPRKQYARSTLRYLAYLAGTAFLILVPFILYLQFYNMDLLSFFRQMLYDTRAYSYYPLLIAELSTLSQYYAAGAGLLLLGSILRLIFTDSKNGLDELIILFFFIVISTIYLPQLSISTGWFDPDQLNGFYALLISILLGIAFAHVMRFINWIIRYQQSVIKIIESFSLVAGITALIYLQGGVEVSRVLPSTTPNGFHEAYYQIIDEHLPYSYATVGPEIDRSLAKNRHYFMNYNYFLNQYGSIDSLYQQWLLVPPQQRTNQAVPPPSIFVFVEKPPYGSIQQGILYNSSNVMRNIEQWFSQFRELEGRTVNTYYSSDQVTVYEIVNRKGEAEIDEVLLHIHPTNRADNDE
ncbi:MAG: hypothetical protein U5K69_20665 [Balneolaceae bacterium]|nr:hypothetical protein [Balneolaceae bacterium]